MPDRSPAAARKALRAAGVDVPARGPLGDEHWLEYDRISGGYDGGTSPDDFDGPDQLGADDDSFPDVAQGGAPSALEAEAVPRAVGGQRDRPPAGKRGRSAASRAQQMWKRAAPAAAGGSQPKKSRPSKGPWMPTATVIEHLWSQLAWSARPLPPLQKILAAQAPMAGVTLQDAAKGTFIDRALLQPAARAENKLQAANAMLGPPIWTLLIAGFGGCVTAPMAGPDGVVRQVPVTDAEDNIVWDDRTQVLVGGLRFSLMSWLKVADKHADEIMADAQELTELGDQADALIRWILAPSQPGQSPKDVEREARRRGTDFGAQTAANGTGPAGEPTAAPSSAFTPAPARGPSGSRN